MIVKQYGLVNVFVTNVKVAVVTRSIGVKIFM